MIDHRKPGVFPTWHGWLFPIFMALLTLAGAGLAALIVYRLVSAVTF